MSLKPLKPVHVKTPHGQLVHASTVKPDLAGQLASPWSLQCRRIPWWHNFTETDEPITCPKCLDRIGA